MYADPRLICSPEHRQVEGAAAGHPHTSIGTRQPRQLAPPSAQQTDLKHNTLAIGFLLTSSEHNGYKLWPLVYEVVH